MVSATTTSPSVFLDSSVFFAAAYSATGSAHDLFLVASQGRITIVLCSALPYRLSHPPKSLIVDTSRVVVTKDASIIAAARAAQVSLVATYDRRHLLAKRQEILTAFGITVATPKEILASLEDPLSRP